MTVCSPSNRLCCRLSALHCLMYPVGKYSLFVPRALLKMVFSFSVSLSYNAPSISETIQLAVIIGRLAE